MTPFARILRNVVQRTAGVFYEGPEPPERLSLLVQDFANLHPEAKRSQWADFAKKLAREAYRSGYVRGFERSERDDDYLPKIPPELVADSLDPDWRWTPAFGDDLLHPDDPVVDEASPAEIDLERAEGGKP